MPHSAGHQPSLATVLPIATSARQSHMHTLLPVYTHMHTFGSIPDVQMIETTSGAQRKWCAGTLTCLSTYTFSVAVCRVKSGWLPCGCMRIPSPRQTRRRRRLPPAPDGDVAPKTIKTWARRLWGRTILSVYLSGGLSSGKGVVMVEWPR